MSAHVGDLDGDGDADDNFMNQDTNGDGKCDLNCDTNGDGFPDINIDVDGDGEPDINIDTDGDGEPDKNIDFDNNGTCDRNCEETDGGMLDISASEDTPIVFVSEQQAIEAPGILPGWTQTQKLVINNRSDVTLPYSIKFKDVINQFNPTSELVYSVRRDGVLVKGEQPCPTSESYIVQTLLIPAHTSYTYEITYHFIETGMNQNYQQGKNFKATIAVETN